MIIREIEYLDRKLMIRGGPRRVSPSVSAISVSAANAPQYGKDVVSYRLSNASSRYAACVLYRGVENISPPYYFGNAFYAVYTGKINGQSSAFWLGSGQASAATPQGPGSNYALTPLDLGSGNDLACFVFGIPPQSAIEILEGGIPDAAQINVMTAYEVTLGSPGSFCVQYNQQAVKQYIHQTGYSVTPPPDPFPEDTVPAIPVQKGIPDNEIYPGQYVKAGGCT
ncbi:MAG: hypothetical protein ACYCT2_08595 [Thermoplasmataceae archaeon]